MISKQQIKFIHSLRMKKHRDENSLFVGEGPKVVCELLRRFQCAYLAATPSWLQKNKASVPTGTRLDIVTAEELIKASLLDTPQQVLGIFRKRQATLPSAETVQSELCLMLDTIQDPGNLGTILRLAQWYGINHIICSPDTADIYSPKTVQATMGALGKTNVAYTQLPQYLNGLPDATPIYGTFLDSNDIYDTSLQSHGIIVMGNEGNGISPQVAQHIKHRLHIPPYPPGPPAIESLNVGVATAIVCAEFRRRQMHPD